jgi:vacuolar-type H+-ATPase subunit I/STV1
MLAAINALAAGGGVDSAPIVAAIREEAERTRQVVVDELQTVIADQAAELEQLRARLAAAAQAQAEALQEPAA